MIVRRGTFQSNRQRERAAENGVEELEQDFMEASVSEMADMVVCEGWLNVVARELAELQRTVLYPAPQSAPLQAWSNWEATVVFSFVFENLQLCPSIATFPMCIVSSWS